MDTGEHVVKRVGFMSANKNLLLIFILSYYDHSKRSLDSFIQLADPLLEFFNRVELLNCFEKVVFRDI